jgi:hypothetical protein
MKSYLHHLGFLLVAALIFTAGCASSASSPPLPTDLAGARWQISQWVPLDTQLADAKKTMEAHGFQCSVTRNAPFDEARNVDYLYCDLVWSANDSGLVVKRRWQAALILTNDKVSNIYVSTGLVGL